MAQWLIGYVVGAYVSLANIPIQTPGAIRRIVHGFYIHNNTTVPVPLTPVQTADADNEVQIYGRTNVRIRIVAGLTNPVVFLFCETELAPGENVGTPHAITA